MKPRSHEATKPRRQRQSRPIRPSLCAIRYSPLRSPLPTTHYPAFTLVELLVVIVIIAILVSAVLVASSTLVNNSRVNNTKAVLQLVNSAIQEFKRERPAMLQGAYLKRYGPYPPDELEVFVAAGFPKIGTRGSLAPGGASSVPSSFSSMKFYPTSSSEDAQEHRDLAAMIVAIETLTEGAASTLAKIPDRNRTAGALDGNGNPIQCLSRPAAPGQGANGNCNDPEDFQIRYIVDDWGVPLGYLAQRDWVQGKEAQTVSTNHGDWNKVSTQIIRLNGGEPVIFSWGPDGKEQLTRDVMSDEDENPASLVADFAKDDRYKIVHSMNADNIYVNDALRDKLTGEVQ